MATVRWSLAANNNLVAILQYLLEVSPDYATKFFEQAQTVTSDLQSFPNMGRIVPEYNEISLRELLVERHRVLYEVAGDQVQILDIIDARRDLRAAFGEYPRRLNL